MVYFLNLDGTMTLAEPQRVFQGSNNVNTVYVLSAIAPPTALEISFTLPSGLTTAYYPMIYNGATDEYTVPNTTTTVYLRSFLLTSNITAEVGTVGVSVNAVYSNADGTTGNQTSFTGSFNVEYSSIPETVTTGAADELQQALDLLSQYYTQQQAIITGGTNGEYLQSKGNNQLPVWTSFDMDFVTANRAQSFSNAQKAQARTNIGALSSADLSVWSQRTTTEEDLNVLANVADKNAYISRYAPSTANTPVANTYGNVISLRNSGAELTQLAMEVQSGKVYYRASAAAAGVGTWKEIGMIQAQSSNYIVYTSGLKIQWGEYSGYAEGASGQEYRTIDITFPLAFSNTNYTAIITNENDVDNAYKPYSASCAAKTTAGMTVGQYKLSTASWWTGFNYLVIGW